MNARIVSLVKAHQRTLLAILAFAFVFALLATPMMSTMAQSSETIEIDLSPLFLSINTWIPTFLPIIAIGGGIAIAIAIGMWVVNMLISSLKSAGAGRK